MEGPGYTRANVEALEGRYVCFRPAFSATDVISAYLMFVHWDEAESASRSRNGIVSMPGTRKEDEFTFRMGGRS